MKLIDYLKGFVIISGIIGGAYAGYMSRPYIERFLQLNSIAKQKDIGRDKILEDQKGFDEFKMNQDSIKGIEININDLEFFEKNERIIIRGKCAGDTYIIRVENEKEAGKTSVKKVTIYKYPFKEL